MINDEDKRDSTINPSTLRISMFPGLDAAPGRTWMEKSHPSSQN
jgi:hypothetical protein